MLTERDRLVLERIARGETNQEIAAGLFISIETAKSYKRRLFVKLAAKNAAHAVALGFSAGELRLETSRPTLDVPAGEWEISGTIKDGSLILAFSPTA